MWTAEERTKARHISYWATNKKTQIQVVSAETTNSQAHKTKGVEKVAAELVKSKAERRKEEKEKKATEARKKEILQRKHTKYLERKLG